MKLSIVTTLYYSENYILELYKRATNIAKQLADDEYEIIMVDDGSPDKSLEYAVELSKNDSHIVVIELSRNFGHHKAILAGLTYAKSEKIFLIDSDLEEEPNLLETFDKVMNQENCDVVYGVQEKRKGKFFERITGQIFWSIFNFLSGLKITPNIVTARLMTKRYVKALLQHEEREIFLAGLWEITGFRQRPIKILKNSKGISTYNFRRKFSLFIRALTSFSNIPLIGIFYVGILITFLSLTSVIYILIRKLFFLVSISGWTSILVSIWFLGGILMLFLGVQGIYLSKIFNEVKHRPLFLIRTIYGKHYN